MHSRTNTWTSLYDRNLNLRLVATERFGGTNHMISAWCQPQRRRISTLICSRHLEIGRFRAFVNPIPGLQSVFETNASAQVTIPQKVQNQKTREGTKGQTYAYSRSRTALLVVAGHNTKIHRASNLLDVQIIRPEHTCCVCPKLVLGIRTCHQTVPLHPVTWVIIR